MTDRKKKNILSLIGPGFITAALVLGPGSLAIGSKIGANYEFRLLWVVPICILFMAAFTIVSTRIGLSSKQTLIELIREKYGNTICIVIGVGLFIVSASFQAGNSIGAGMVFGEMFNVSPVPWIIGFSVIAIILLFFKSFFKILEKIMIGMVVLMLVSFVLTLIISKPNISLLIQQFNFELPSGSEFLALALVASSFSIAGAFYQSYLVQEKGWDKSESKSHERESLSGVFILGVITATVMLVAASVLYPQGIQVNSAAEMGKALEPIFGSYATVIFMFGLFAASFSSLIGNATLGGVLLSDALNIGRKLESQNVRYVIMSVILIGAAVAIIFGNLPIQLIIMAQGFTIIVVPVIGFMIFMIARDRAAKHFFKLSTTLNIIMILGLVMLVLLAGANTYNIFIK
ncbi:Nramp family divalent metal transporter [Zobellia barbeyronii]|uniref:Nramp family divalent metal transporter n=1 Tax=Zobellia barbeyronii TaxID=2748009 RepID=A0ABS5WGC2_9FLAO|nr:Nramp family divalent metal transporter [Zobellia barbeyronii]MBT2161227.1 Nramp family divalent metal transporter [Zobellia barbeyronii]